MARNAWQDKDYPPDPHGYYQEDRSCVEQLFDALDFGDDLIFDPCCGRGNILDVAKSRGHLTIGSDIVQRGSRHQFFRANILQQRRFPSSPGRRMSIVCNPPFNTPPGSGLAIINHIREYAPFRRAAFIMPLKFLSGQDRYEELYSTRAVSHVAICSQRPSMPPGLALEEFGEDIRGGGKDDFVWIVLAEDGPHRCETLWLKPDRVDVPNPIRRIRRGSQQPSASARS